MFYLLLSRRWGAPPKGNSLVVDEEIVVTATQQTEVYVAPTKAVHNGKIFDLDTQTVSGQFFPYGKSGFEFAICYIDTKSRENMANEATDYMSMLFSNRTLL